MDVDVDVVRVVVVARSSSAKRRSLLHGVPEIRGWIIRDINDLIAAPLGLERARRARGSLLWNPLVVELLDVYRDCAPRQGLAQYTQYTDMRIFPHEPDSPFQHHSHCRHL